LSYTDRQRQSNIITSARAENSGTASGPHKCKRHERVQALYQRRDMVVCCIIPGEMDDGGLAMRLPVEGFTMGMALVRDERIAEGW